MPEALAGEFAAYSLSWADEFDGAAGTPPDDRVWRPETGGHGWGNQELQYYTDSVRNAALDGAGHLAVTVRRADPREAARRYDGRGYTSARRLQCAILAADSWACIDAAGDNWADLDAVGGA